MVDVAVVSGARAPALVADRDSSFEARSNLDDRVGRLHGVESELAADDEREGMIAASTVIRDNTIDHLGGEHVRSRTRAAPRGLDRAHWTRPALDLRASRADERGRLKLGYFAMPLHEPGQP